MLSTHPSRTRSAATRWGAVAALAALLGPGAAAAATSPAAPPDTHAPALPSASAAVAAPPAAGSAAPLPFLAAKNARDRFAVSEFTKAYEEPLLVFASQSSSRSPRTLEWLDHQAEVAAAAAAAARNDSSDVRVATGGSGSAATIPPEEKKALEPAKPPLAVGIPSPVAIAGSLAGGLVLLVKLLTAMAH